MHIGGPADLFYALKNIDELTGLVETAKILKIPHIIIGGGTNIIFSDRGFRGLVIRMQAQKIDINGNKITAEAGAPLALVIQKSLQHNLTGLQRLSGLPGTIGGAVRGNAGCNGTEIKDVFESAQVYLPNKGICTLKAKDLAFAYRHSALKKNPGIILKVTLKLKKEDCSKAALEAKELITSRAGKQPAGKTCGSFFKNPQPELSAGYLLDQTGCKGLQYGNAQVSWLHANWIMNLGGATQADVADLAGEMRERVRDRFDITLIPEVQFVGETGFIEI